VSASRITTYGLKEQGVDGKSIKLGKDSGEGASMQAPWDNICSCSFTVTDMIVDAMVRKAYMKPAGMDADWHDRHSLLTSSSFSSGYGGSKMH
jgi:hypothetical protein